MLRLTDEFAHADIIRTRDSEVLKELDIVVDVGAEYDDARRRYDHHQRSFTETFSETYSHVKLSSAGLVYRHFGKEILRKLTGGDDESIETVYQRVYKTCVAEIDG